MYAPAVLDNGRLAQVNRQFADVLYIIADTLQVLGYEKQLRGGRNTGRVPDHPLYQLAEYAVIRPVYLLVALDNLPRHVGILGRKSIERRPQHLGRDLGHHRHVHVAADLGLVVQDQRRLGNIGRVVGDALENGRDLCHGYYKTQVVGGRLLRADYVDAETVDLELHEVDGLVLGKHLSRQVAVTLGKRAHRALQCRLGHAAEK